LKRAVIFGTTGFAEVAHAYLSADSPYEIAAFTVHREFRTSEELLGLPVVPFEELEERYPPRDVDMFVAMGFGKVNKRRAEVYALCKSKGYRLLTYVNSRAIYWGELNVGDNCFILENNVIQPFVTIGNNVVLWSGNHIGHHSRIGDNCFISSHVVISGNCDIGNNTFIGVNATLRDGIKVAPECIIGAGALILKNTVERGVYQSSNTVAANITSDKLRGF
jgi:sugar O-acyltransferase (sialic acid O-acetyltransferase NeuD family)